MQVSLAAYPPSQAEVIFRSGNTWDMRLEGDGYRLTHYRGIEEDRSIVALSDASTERVCIYACEEVRSSDAPGCIANPMQYPVDQLLLMNHLAKRAGMIVHSAGVVIDGHALVFPGVSTAGKSTLCRLFVDAGLGDALLSDDRIIVRVAAHGPGRSTHLHAWGTPWAGDAQIADSAGAPLAALLFLVKSDVNEVVALSPGMAMRRLMPVVSCPWYDRERGSGVLDTCALLVENTPCYDLRFRPDAEVVDLLVGGAW